MGLVLGFQLGERDDLGDAGGLGELLVLRLGLGGLVRPGAFPVVSSGGVFDDQADLGAVEAVDRVRYGSVVVGILSFEGEKREKR